MFKSYADVDRTKPCSFKLLGSVSYGIMCVDPSRSIGTNEVHSKYTLLFPYNILLAVTCLSIISHRTSTNLHCGCVFAHLCVNMIIYLSICLSVCVCASFCISAFLRVCLYACLSVFVSVCLSACLRICLSLI